MSLSFEVLVAMPCLTLCNPTVCSLPSSCIHGIFQARILEWVAISFSRVSMDTVCLILVHKLPPPEMGKSIRFSQCSELQSEAGGWCLWFWKLFTRTFLVLEMGKRLTPTESHQSEHTLGSQARARRASTIPFSEIWMQGRETGRG